MPDKELAKYSRLIALRNILKEIQQLSWNINQLDKKFPIEEADVIGYEALIKAYSELGESILPIADNFKKEMKR